MGATSEEADSGLVILFNLLKEHHHALWLELNIGADPSIIYQVEATLGLKFDPALRRSYEAHDGQRSYLEKRPAPSLIGRYQFFPLSTVTELWHDLNRQFLADPESFDAYGANAQSVLNYVWHPKLVPIGETFFGTLLCIDFQPSETGTKGQVVEIDFEDVTSVIAPSLSVYADMVIEQLIDGRLVVGRNGIRPPT